MGEKNPRLNSPILTLKCWPSSKSGVKSLPAAEMPGNPLLDVQPVAKALFSVLLRCDRAVFFRGHRPSWDWDGLVALSVASYPQS